MAPEPELAEYYRRASEIQVARPDLASADLVSMAESEDLETCLLGIGLLSEWVADRELVAVFKARAANQSWGWIGARLGRTRQALWERYRDRTDMEAGPNG
jgi:hypothetical protein